LEKIIFETMKYGLPGTRQEEHEGIFTEIKYFFLLQRPNQEHINWISILYPHALHILHGD
jgi:hypothetical protein